ncbi:hypothetical protein [Sphingobacterium corticibacter]|uniref:Uncharacterized protein n=1 Tax=Sphingobacterium corticibacter TaxID=2171749 RepID=A0A2T8HFV7_9SPHI|nr:hypothetical protein [Sphingobacterium corticibacter]PVH24294.1 hypothetical protein DC487_14515 [Sphingobacterium corticibacter]
MNTTPPRFIIHPQDIALILGVSIRQAYRYFRLVRAAHRKSDHHLLTADEFAAYYDISVEEVRKHLE